MNQKSDSVQLAAYKQLLASRKQYHRRYKKQKME